MENLTTYKQRIEADKKLGLKSNSFAIDRAHRAMFLFKSAHRENLLKYLSEYASTSEAHVWRVLNSLFEILPNGTEDHKQVSGLLTNKDSLLRDAQGLEKQGKQLEIELV